MKVVTNLHEGADDEAFCGGVDVALLGQPLQVLKGHHHAVPLLGGDSQLEAELVHRGALDMVQPPKNSPTGQTLSSTCLCQIQSDHSASALLLHISNIIDVGNDANHGDALLPHWYSYCVMLLSPLGSQAAMFVQLHAKAMQCDRY